MLDTLKTFVRKKPKWYDQSEFYKQSQISFNEFQFFLQRGIQQRGLLICLMLMLFAVCKRLSFLLLDERMRSSRSSSTIRRFLSRVRCICRTRIEGWCCSSRDLSSVMACRLLLFLRIRYGGRMNINSGETCMHVFRKKGELFLHHENAISDTAHFYVSRDTSKIICRHAYALSSIKIHMYKLLKLRRLQKKSRNF